jgi:hypothetical protein
MSWSTNRDRVLGTVIGFGPVLSRVKSPASLRGIFLYRGGGSRWHELLEGFFKPLGPDIKPPENSLRWRSWDELLEGLW